MTHIEQIRNKHTHLIQLLREPHEYRDDKTNTLISDLLDAAFEDLLAGYDAVVM